MLNRIKNIIKVINRSGSNIDLRAFDWIYFSIYKKLKGPVAIEWFPCYLCNSKCLYCGGYGYEERSRFEGNIKKEMIIKIVKLSKRIGVNTWNIGGRGGEPLLYNGLIDVLGEIKRQHLIGIIITNGLLLDELTVKKMVQYKWDIVRISLDSNIAGINDYLRGISGTFQRIDSALRNFRNIKARLNSKTPYVVCCPVLTNKNYANVREYMDYCISMGVDEIQFTPLINVHKEAAILSLSDGEKKHIISLLEACEGEQRIKHNASFIKSLYKDSIPAVRNKEASLVPSFGELTCIHLWKTLVISEDGYLSPCSLIKDKLCKIDNNMLEAWDSKELNILRTRILKGEFINPACVECCGPLRNETRDFNEYKLEKAKLVKGSGN